MITFKDIEDAYATVKAVVHHTPLLTSRSFDELTGNFGYFKAENFQRVGAFKFRGAYNKLASLSREERLKGVIAHSSGNHAQGVALAARMFGTKVVIVMPENSVRAKVDATIGYGAEVVFCGVSTDDRERTTAAIIERNGHVLIHPYDDDKLIAGQGTAALELFEDVDDLDYLFVPVGGGGLISGCAVAAKHRCPSVRVIGVETEGADDCYRSFRRKEIVKLTQARTVADGMRTLSVGVRNFEIIMKYVDDVITVRDEDVVGMMKWFLERMKIVVEPTGAVAAAAMMKNEYGVKGKKVCALISGGNVDPQLLKSIL